MLQRLRERKRILACLGLLVFAYFLSQTILMVEHESAHRQICKAFGGENVTTYTNYSLTGGRTFCGNMTQKALELHSVNEIVTYNLSALVCAFFSGLLVLMVYWEVRG